MRRAGLRERAVSPSAARDKRPVNVETPNSNCCVGGVALLYQRRVEERKFGARRERGVRGARSQRTGSG